MPQITTYPTGGQYREALYNTNICFKDPALTGGEVSLDSLGMPKPISGASASVFTISGTDGRRWAVKCFTRFIDDQGQRYERISESLRSVDRPWRVEFNYLQTGVLCLGIWYPVLKMEWIEASGLISFIENNLQNPQALARLAEAFAAMTGELTALGIAHGDLQHGNLLVTQAGELKLIDYDGMFVPGLAQFGACEKGHVNYQSPARTMRTWGPYLDRFSAWIIYASLLALSIDPGLWVLLRQPGDEALLFHHNDFLNFGRSRAYYAFSHSSQSELRAVGTAMGGLWTPDLTAIPPLDPAMLPEPRTRYTFGPAVSNGAATRQAQSWITQANTAGVPAGTAAAAGASWLAGHLPPLPIIPFDPPRLAGRLWASTTVLAALIAVALAVTGLLPDYLSGAAASASAALFFATTAILFRRTSEWSGKHQKAAQRRQHRSESRDAIRQVSRLLSTRSNLDGQAKKTTDRLVKEASKARAAEQNDLRKGGSDLARQIQGINKQRQALQSGEQREFGNALRHYQQMHVRNYLSQARISSARISGIGPAVVGSLASCGIHSAADFSGIHHQTGPRGGLQIYIRRANGTLVHPNGVGAKKARELEAWRQAVNSQAVARQPTALPADQASAISARFALQRQVLDGQQKAAEAQYVTLQAKVAQKWAPIHADFSTRLAVQNQAAAQDRARIEAEITEAEKQARAIHWQRDMTDRQLAAYHDVSYIRYLARIAGA
jgi:hypothetical protein